MTDLFWPGLGRADSLMTNEALISAMIQVEAAWLVALRRAGISPHVQPELVAINDPNDPAFRFDDEQIEAGGNPVIPLVDALRNRAGESSPATAQWLHRGLTSQDVLDTALLLCVRSVINQVNADLERQVAALAILADAHRTTVAAGRTLTQHATPVTFGLTAANWLHGVIDAGEDLTAVRAGLCVQIGGAAGTRAAIIELLVDTGSTYPAAATRALVDSCAADLGLRASVPWHTSRRPITRIGDALVSCTDAWSRIANDVTLRSRPEIGELAEPIAAGRGGSSTMAHKHNPVLSILIRRAGIAAPFQAAQLHAASAGALDERPDGSWHAEWSALRTLSQITAVAGSQATELIKGLVVRAEQMRATAEAVSEELLTEQRSMRKLTAGDWQSPDNSSLDGYLGAAADLVGAALDRAARFLERRTAA